MWLVGEPVALPWTDNLDAHLATPILRRTHTGAISSFEALKVRAKLEGARGRNAELGEVSHDKARVQPLTTHLFTSHETQAGITSEEHTSNAER